MSNCLSAGVQGELMFSRSCTGKHRRNLQHRVSVDEGVLGTVQLAGDGAQHGILHVAHGLHKQGGAVIPQPS